MVYVIIGVALLFIIVPIIAVLPSGRQKEQMVMRKTARDAGISVELTAIEDPNPKQDKYISHTGRALPASLKVTAYRIQRRRVGDWRRLPAVNWCLQNITAEGWQWREESGEFMSGALKDWLDQEVPGLPGDVEQVEESGYNIVVYWHERTTGSEIEILNFLKTCAEMPLHEPEAEEPES